MIYKIPIHSVIDVITNSSTEIYVSSNDKSIELMKDFIEDIMKATGSKGKVEDYFELWTEKSENYDDFEQSNLMIKTKNKEATNLNDTFTSIFDVYESYG